MSEATPNELIRRVGFAIRSASVIPMPIDPTLSNEGEAADAKATGDAIAAVMTGATVNGRSPTGKAFMVYGVDIPVSTEEGAPTVAEAIEDAADRTADDIDYDAVNQVTVKDALDDIYDTLDTELSTEEIDDIFDEVFGGDD